jgi:hypothetical protein
VVEERKTFDFFPDTETSLRFQTSLFVKDAGYALEKPLHEGVYSFDARAW